MGDVRVNVVGKGIGKQVAEGHNKRRSLRAPDNEKYTRPGATATVNRGWGKNK